MEMTRKEAIAKVNELINAGNNLSVEQEQALIILATWADNTLKREELMRERDKEAKRIGKEILKQRMTEEHVIGR